MESEQRGRGRPRKLKLVTIDEALKIVEEHYQHPMFSKGTIYNKISSGVLKNYGRAHKALLDETEVREKLCS